MVAVVRLRKAIRFSMFGFDVRHMTDESESLFQTAKRNRGNERVGVEMLEPDSQFCIKYLISFQASQP